MNQTQKVQNIKVKGDEDGQRMDRWLKKHLPKGTPFSLIQKILRTGQVRVDGKRAKTSTRLEEGQTVRLPPVEAKPLESKPKIKPEDAAFIKSLIIYQDEHIIALNKPDDIAVQGGTGTRRHIDGLLEVLANKEGVKPRLVHRLDKETSGVLLLARSAKMARDLGEMFKRRDVKKIYFALVSPPPEEREGTIKAPLAKIMSGPNKENMAVDTEEGKSAITDFVVMDEALGQAAFVAFWPRTGRTHQIRAHAQYMNAPIIGDDKYPYIDPEPNNPESRKPIEKGSLEISDRLHLHAARLIFKHPALGRMMDIQAPMPPALIKSWKSFGFDINSKVDPFE